MAFLSEGTTGMIDVIGYATRRTYDGWIQESSSAKIGLFVSFLLLTKLL